MNTLYTGARGKVVVLNGNDKNADRRLAGCTHVVVVLARPPAAGRERVAVGITVFKRASNASSEGKVVGFENSATGSIAIRIDTWGCRSSWLVGTGRSVCMSASPVLEKKQLKSVTR